MIVTNEAELSMLLQVGRVVAETLHKMVVEVRAGISTKELDVIGEAYLSSKGARSAPRLIYGFPGSTCISVNDVVAHGISYAVFCLKKKKTEQSRPRQAASDFRTALLATLLYAGRPTVPVGAPGRTAAR